MTKLSNAQKGALLYCLANGMISRTTYGSTTGVNDGSGDLHKHGRVTSPAIYKLVALGLLVLDAAASTPAHYKSIWIETFQTKGRGGFRSIPHSESVFRLTELGRATAERLSNAELAELRATTEASRETFERSQDDNAEFAARFYNKH